MDNRELFTAALGLQEPWRVARMNFDAEGQQLDIALDFARGARFPCPEGDQSECQVHDTAEKTWRHLDFFQHRAYLHARVPRISCPAHGVRQVALPWARPGSGFTLLFEALLMTLMSEMPVKAVADVVGEHDTRLWRVLRFYVHQARAHTSTAGVTTVGIDETSVRRGHNYISLFCDLDVPRLLFATPTRTSAAVARFAKDLTAHGGDPSAVTEICVDMFPAYIKGCGEQFPNASLTFDRYHLATKIGFAVDKVRKAESKRRAELRGTRFVWLKRPHNLTVREQARLAYLEEHEANLETLEAYRWRLSFDAFFDQSPELAGAFLEEWCAGVMDTELEPMHDFANTVLTHWDGVIRWHQSKVSNGILEAFNSLIQAAKRRARGYRTTDNLIAMAYLIVGKLNLQLAHTN